MDMSSSILIDSFAISGYKVQIINNLYCSPKFLSAQKMQTLLSARDLIEEDHYQLNKTLDIVCRNCKDLTEETKLMLEILRSTNTIENAIYKISRNLEFMHKVFSEIRQS